MVETGQPGAVFERIAADLRASVADGSWKPGEKIPSTHQLARTYKVTPTTIQSAVRLLKKEGLLTGKQGAGTFVAAPGSRDANVFAALHADLAKPEGFLVDFFGFKGSAVVELLEGARVYDEKPQILPVQMRVLLTWGSKLFADRVRAATLQDLDLQVRWYHPTTGRRRLDMAPFLRLTNGEVFMALDGEQSLEDPAEVLHFQIQRSETDALRRWFDARWEAADPAS